LGHPDVVGHDRTKAILDAHGGGEMDRIERPEAPVGDPARTVRPVSMDTHGACALAPFVAPTRHPGSSGSELVTAPGFSGANRRWRTRTGWALMLKANGRCVDAGRMANADLRIARRYAVVLTYLAVLAALVAR
jgi:hypothetical protein